MKSLRYEMQIVLQSECGASSSCELLWCLMFPLSLVLLAETSTHGRHDKAKRNEVKKTCFAGGQRANRDSVNYDLPCTPGIDGLFEKGNIPCLVIIVCVWRIARNNSVNSRETRAFVDRSCDEHVPMLEAILPRVKLSVTTLPSLTLTTLRVDAWPISNAALIA